MSAEDELLSNFLASIDKLSAAQSSQKPEENVKRVVFQLFIGCRHHKYEVRGMFRSWCYPLSFYL